MNSWHVGNLPFVFSVQKEPGNSGFPEFLPFRLGVNEKDGYFFQPYDTAVDSVLDKAYSSGSMLSGLMDEGGIGQHYAEDFLKFICEVTPSVKESKVLDVGCGTGYLLSRLKGRGAKVLGLEPGKHGIEGATRHQIPIIRDFFPTPKASGTFNLISAFGLLEHIVDPEQMLFQMKDQLTDNGWLVLGVPDCKPYLTAGDISFLFHEHWNYFTQESITNLVGRVFGRDPIVKRAGFGGSLYVGVQKCKTTAGNHWMGRSGTNVQQGDELSEYVALAKKRNKRFWGMMEEAWTAGETVGIYVPWRAVNILALRPPSIPAGALRFFDDNPVLHHTYYPGFPVPVESRAQLVDHPPDRLLILSNTFSEDIERQLQSRNLGIPIYTWRQLYGS